jgi:D-serine dehydratase
MTADAPHAIARGEIELPVMTLDRPVWENNLTAMLDFCRSAGALFAPHAKTAMIPSLAMDAVQQGAWGASVADVRQAESILKCGISNVIIANQVVGRTALDHLADLQRQMPEASIAVFVDSDEGVDRLVAAALRNGTRFRVLLEIGGGRAGLRSSDEAKAIAERLLGLDCITLVGIACYEGSVASADHAETVSRIDALLAMTSEVAFWLRERDAHRPIMLSAGGSLYFDLVIERLATTAQRLGNAEIVLRSGAGIFHDHGIYQIGVEKMRQRNLSGSEEYAGHLRPALRVWTEILSRPEPKLAIAGAGMRHLSFDQGLPVVLNCYRDGRMLTIRPGEVRIVRLNDQHAFVKLPEDSNLAVGDVLELGISHPCTAMDRWRQVTVLDRTGITGNLDTEFG